MQTTAYHEKPCGAVPTSRSIGRDKKSREYTRERYPGLRAFLEHSDCDGQIEPEVRV